VTRAQADVGYRFATEDVWLRRGKAPSSPQHDFLTFLVGEEEYAVDIQRIREIIKLRAVTEVPHVPSFVWGVIAVRGVVVPVIDLRLRLRLPSSGLARTSRFLVVEKGEEEPFGLLVDEVRQVVRLGDGDIEPRPAMLTGAEADFVVGIGRTKGRMLILLDVDQVLSFEVGPARRRDPASELDKRPTARTAPAEPRRPTEKR
jgi:purine-binding chemotaxis protein CheW